MGGKKVNKSYEVEEEKIIEEVVKEISKWHLKVYDLIEETVIIDGYFDTKENAKDKLEDAGIVDLDRHEITLEKESIFNKKSISLALKKYKRLVITRINNLKIDLGLKSE